MYSDIPLLLIPSECIYKCLFQKRELPFCSEKYKRALSDYKN